MKKQRIVILIGTIFGGSFVLVWNISGTNLSAQSSCEQNWYLQHAWWHNRTSTSLKHQNSRWLKQYSQVSFSLKDPAIISFTSSNDNLTSARMSMVQKFWELGNWLPMHFPKPLHWLLPIGICWLFSGHSNPNVGNKQQALAHQYCTCLQPSNFSSMLVISLKTFVDSLDIPTIDLDEQDLFVTYGE